VEKIRHTMRRISGAYSLVIMTADRVFAARDPMGVRPLCLGSIDGGYCVASETCALDNLSARFLREVNPGEIVELGPDGYKSYSGVLPTRDATCIFEYIYFARPDSVIKDRLLYEARENMGRMLAREHPVEADLVIAVPDSATAAGIGYSKESGIPFSEGLLKNRYVGRTFIQPDQRMRESGVNLKFNPLPHILKGKRIVLVDDSIVRGTTTPRVIQMLRRAGVEEIHMRVCAPPITNPCHFGVDMATRYELIAANKTVPQIQEYIGADSLGYLSIPGLIDAVDLPRNQFCLACFTGEYPVPVQLEMDKLALEREVVPV
jgi:amidophosphoribosyltransferase